MMISSGNLTARSTYSHSYENQPSLAWFLQTSLSHDLTFLKQNPLCSLTSSTIPIKWPAHVLSLPNHHTKRSLCACDKTHPYLNLRVCQCVQVRSHASNKNACRYSIYVYIRDICVKNSTKWSGTLQKDV